MAAEELSTQPRIFTTDFAPPIPPKDEINHYYNQMRSLGDHYEIEKEYGKWLLYFRKVNSPKEMLTDKGFLRQDYFQPASVVPTEELVEALMTGMVKYGVNPLDRQKIAGEIPKKYPCDAVKKYLDIWIQMCLGVVDCTVYNDYKFRDKNEIDEIRLNNMEIAERTNRKWGNFLWNINYPPVPRKYMDRYGNFTGSEPLESDYVCQLRREFDRLGWTEDLDTGIINAGIKNHATHSTRATARPQNSRRQPSRRKKKMTASKTLLNMGFKRTPKKRK